MRVLRVNDTGRDFSYKWPGGTETYANFIEYDAIAQDGNHSIIIGFRIQQIYERDRVKVVVWIDNHPHAEFLGADDFERSGEVLSEIRVPGDVGLRICRYPDEPIPEYCSMFNVIGLPLRVQGSGVHQAWAVVANIADHQTMIALAALRRLERRK